MEADERALDRFIQEHADDLLELFDELDTETGVQQAHVFPARPGEVLIITVARRRADTQGNPEPNSS